MSAALAAARAALAPHISGVIGADPDAAAESLAAAWALLDGELFHSDLSAHRAFERAAQTTQARAERLIDRHLIDLNRAPQLWGPKTDRVALDTAYSWRQA